MYYYNNAFITYWILHVWICILNSIAFDPFIETSSENWLHCVLRSEKSNFDTKKFKNIFKVIFQFAAFIRFKVDFNEQKNK